MQLITKNKTYGIEYTFEAAESPIVQKVFDYFSGAYMLKAVSEKKEEEMTEEEKVEAKGKQVDAMISGISQMPPLAIDFLYVGLLENHGIEGDGTVTCRLDAKRVYKEFCKENPDDELAMHINLFNALKGQMEEDGFFKRIGLDTIMEQMNPKSKEVKTPQDRKPKQNKKTEA